ncbi:MAG TPA: Hsp20/alpha crystallin family protein [Gaiellaceae bacterium]|jgi:HSP20 family protein|nr:Hsp20/alpha crystallin family protein [Gaiellaceae bacterium]
MATLVRWEPFREIATLQNDMNRLMNTVMGGNGESQPSRTWVPAVDVWESENELVYAFDLPGIPEDHVVVEYEDGALIVTAERERAQEVSDEKFYRFERRFGTFSRTVGLPQGVTEDAIKADFKDGVLEVHVAKPEQPTPRRIEIGTTDKKTIEGSAKKA